jgi:predicted phosphodiesterase
MLFGGWIVGAIAFLGVLWLFNVLARAYYNYSLYPGHKRKRKNPQYKSKKPQKSIQQRIGTHYFDPVARRIDADVIITGHTHLPDIYTPEHLPNKLVVNSGSWIMQGNNTHDTFVYIDKRGVRLLQWQDKGGYVSQLESSLL